LWFEGRELPSYAEPISSDDLKVGSVYFIVNYVDSNALIPTMLTVVFIGKNLDQKAEESYFFQDIDSYNEGVPYDFECENHNSAVANFYKCGEYEINGIYDFEHALEELMRCSLARRVVKGSCSVEKEADTD
jgi:hypothetical protein